MVWRVCSIASTLNGNEGCERRPYAIVTIQPFCAVRDIVLLFRQRVRFFVCVFLVVFNVCFHPFICNFWALMNGNRFSYGWAWFICASVSPVEIMAGNVVMPMSRGRKLVLFHSLIFPSIIIISLFFVRPAKTQSHASLWQMLGWHEHSLLCHLNRIRGKWEEKRKKYAAAVITLKQAYHISI